MRRSSREYGIPGIVGTRDETERITDGIRVRVDGDAGEVTVLGEAAVGNNAAGVFLLDLPQKTLGAIAL